MLNFITALCQRNSKSLRTQMSTRIKKKTNLLVNDQICSPSCMKESRILSSRSSRVIFILVNDKEIDVSLLEAEYGAISEQQKTGQLV